VLVIGTEEARRTRYLYSGIHSQESKRDSERKDVAVRNYQWTLQTWRGSCSAGRQLAWMDEVILRHWASQVSGAGEVRDEPIDVRETR
jgi:hypothetical protein